jgi:hypothetical protein
MPDLQRSKSMDISTIQYLIVFYRCIKACINVLKHVNHRYYCQRTIKDLIACPNYQSIALESTQYPDLTSYRLNLESNHAFTIVVQSSKVIAQKRHTATAATSATKTQPTESKDAEYNFMSRQEARLLEFDSPSELAEYISIVS